MPLIFSEVRQLFYDLEANFRLLDKLYLDEKQRFAMLDGKVDFVGLVFWLLR